MHLFAVRAARRAALCLACALFAAPTLAQPAPPSLSNTEGLFLQLSLDGQSLNYNEDDFAETDDGGGLSLRIGYGVSPLVTLYLGLGGAEVDGKTNGVINQTYDWGGVELGSRFNFRQGRRWVPYVDVALRGVAAMADDVDLEFTGGGLSVGGGLAYFVSPTVALEAGLRVGAGSFNEVRFGRISAEIDADEFGYGESRFSLGVTLYPMR